MQVDGFKIPSSQSLDVLVHLAMMFKISLSHPLL